MVKMNSLALAAGLAFLLITGGNGALAQNAQPQNAQPTAPVVSGAVIKPASSASAVSKPITVDVAKPTVAAANPAPAAKPAEVKVPAPVMTLPATPPVVATAPKPAAASEQAAASKPAAPAPDAAAAKTTATTQQQAAAPRQAATKQAAAKPDAAKQKAAAAKAQPQKDEKAASAAKPGFLFGFRLQPAVKPAADKKAADTAKPAKPGQKVANAATKPAKAGDEDGKPARNAKAGTAKEAEKTAKEKQAPKNQAPVVQAKLDEGGVVMRQTPQFFFGLFDAPKPEMESLSEEQVQHDQQLAAVPEKKRFKVKDEFVPVTVPFKGYKPGTIVIDTKEKYLYFVESPISAIRYAVAVGKEGLLFTGRATVGAKQPWPRWIPTKEMIDRDPAKYGKYVDGMEGGPDNPLGARAIYLYQGKQDTYLRIHGTNQPQSIGTASSNGCFRMINEHVIDLYKRVEMGAEVIVM